MELQSLICMDILVMFYCTNVQFYPSIFNVSLNLCTSVQKYMYKMYIPLYKQCIIRLFCNVYQCTIISYCNCVPVYDHLFLHLPLCTSVPNNVPVYEMQMCTSVCKVCLCHGIVYKCTQWYSYVYNVMLYQCLQFYQSHCTKWTAVCKCFNVYCIYVMELCTSALS